MNLFSRIQELYQKGHRQKHECTCGPSSFVLASHALGFSGIKEEDFISERFSRWMPVDQFLKRGMAIHEAQFIGETFFSGKMEVILRRAFPENRKLWEEDLTATANSTTQVIVINFSQDYLLQNSWSEPGNPHYSVIADYQDGQVQIADVDLEIQELYSCSIDRVFESMAFANPAFQLPRGWLILRKR